MAEKDYLKNCKPLKFGTSGLRDLVGNMTDMECYINTTGFIKFLIDRNEIDEANNKIALAGDYRGSTPGIMTAVARAIDDSGCSVINCGLVPTPVLVLFAMRKKIPSIMVTGSHIPDNRNGIKFTKKSGEVLKSDEQDILRNVALAREEIYSRLNNNSPFDPSSGMFKPGSQEPASLENTDESQPDHEEESIDLYLKRYTRVFTNSPLQNKKIVLYQHSAVGRDIVQKIFEALGAKVITVNRSDEFIPVDTEKVSSDTRELLKQWARQHKPFALISTDGDSDRPLLADETGQFLPGDKLGALVSLFLEPDFAAIPISANDAVVSALEAKGVKITQTKIGSPYVVAAMNDELDLNPQAKVVSWESNGGFLLGSDWQIDSKTLKALPTRDAVLPLLTAILLAIRENKSVSELITEKLPSRYTQADVVDNTTPGCENYTADMGKTIINMFSPQNKNIFEIDFSGNTVTVKNMELTDEIRAELKVIKTNISSYFNKETGFSEVISINFTDGIRIVFDNKEVAHLRPSGNAPEFRMYATADTQDRANEIVAKRTEIIPAIVADLDQDSARVRIRQALKEGHPVYLSPYHDPRVWGVGGIGEYWYGAEVGQKSSMAIIEKDSAPLVDIFNEITEDILGKKAAPKLDNILPLVKILTPKSRLSVQFHDTKNELWIITGIDKTLAQGRAKLIIGFSPTVIEKYKDKVTTKYKEALIDYGQALNTLITRLENKGHTKQLENIGNAVTAAEGIMNNDPEIKEIFKQLQNCRKKIEDFYNYHPVQTGDVIPIPSGTLHALGSGIEVVEPQIPGPTQSLEDGATYPVRYYFPGYERAGAKKMLAIDRINEITPAETKTVSPEIIEETEGYTIERLPGNFEDKGLEVHRITLAKDGELEKKSINSFHNLVAVKGRASVTIDNTSYEIPKAVPAGQMLLIPCSAKGYKITASEKAQIIDTFTPV